MPNPIIEEESKFFQSTKIGTRIQERVCELKVHWDERATITVQVTEPADDGYDDAERFAVMDKRATRIAELVANAPRMVNDLYDKKDKPIVNESEADDAS